MTETNEQPLPLTIAELRTQSQRMRRCTVCRKEQATHSVSVTIARLGAGRGSVEFTVPKVPVCESCGAQVVGITRRALKA